MYVFCTFNVNVKIYNNNSNDSWLAHLKGACKIIECNGPETYRERNNGALGLVEYVRGMDVIRAATQEDETMFGDEEWDWLSNKPDQVLCQFIF